MSLGLFKPLTRVVLVTPKSLGSEGFEKRSPLNFQRENGLDVSWQDTLVCSGGKHVIYNGLAVTLNEGDEVIIPTPLLGQLSGDRRALFWDVLCGHLWF